MTACYRLQEREVTSGGGLESLGSNCDVMVEVSMVDLESFVSQLVGEMNSISIGSNETKEIIWSLGGIISVLAGVINGIETLGEIFPKNLPRNPKKIALNAMFTAMSALGVWGCFIFFWQGQKKFK